MCIDYCDGWVMGSGKIDDFNNGDENNFYYFFGFCCV